MRYINESRYKAEYGDIGYVNYDGGVFPAVRITPSQITPAEIVVYYSDQGDLDLITVESESFEEASFGIIRDEEFNNMVSALVKEGWDRSRLYGAAAEVIDYQFQTSRESFSDPMDRYDDMPEYGLHGENIDSKNNSGDNIMEKAHSTKRRKKESTGGKKVNEMKWVAVDPDTGKKTKEFPSKKKAREWMAYQLDVEGKKESDKIMSYVEWEKNHKPYFEDIQIEEDILLPGTDIVLEAGDKIKCVGTEEKIEENTKLAYQLLSDYLDKYGNMNDAARRAVTAILKAGVQLGGSRGMEQGVKDAIDDFYGPAR